MRCQCCGADKARLSAKDSVLIKGNKLLLCTTCKREQHEPRHLVIIASLSGIDIRPYIVNSRYCGKSLEAHEVIH